MTRLTILLAGMLAGDPYQGGATWALLQYALGFERLGHDVWIVEPVAELRPEIEAYFRTVTSAYGFERRAALVGQGDPLPFDPHPDVLVNASGLLREPARTSSIPVRIYLDLDPGFNQLWHEAEGVDVGLDGHTHHVTVGGAIGRDGCPVPTCGVDWIHSLPPVCLEHWPVADRLVHDALTTVGNWRSYGSIVHDGVRFGQKAHSLRAVIELPRHSDERFLLALSIHPDEREDLALLEANGWERADPGKVARTPDDYAEFVRGSKGELGIAKEGYVVSRCGWFSDRSACYLASGRPVVAQDTGFDAFLPTGEGLWSFATVEEAAAAIDALRSDYERHRRAARGIAEDLLDSDRVLTRMLEAL